MWPMPNVMVALPNIGGALCSTPHSSQQRVPILYNGPHLSPSKLPLRRSHGGSGPHLTVVVPCANPSPQPNGISIGAAVFAQHRIVTDQHTQRQTTLHR